MMQKGRAMENGGGEGRDGRRVSGGHDVYDSAMNTTGDSIYPTRRSSKDETRIWRNLQSGTTSTSNDHSGRRT
jgi:hypothetical protein